MKTFPLAILGLSLLLSLGTLPAQAKGKGKPKPPAAVIAPNAEAPAEALAPYINNLDELLALERNVKPPRKLLFDQAPGRLVTLRAQFIEVRDKAPEAEREKFNAAVATCDALTRALDERAAMLGKLSASAAVGGSGKLEKGPRKDNLTQGIHGDDDAKAVGAIAERDRERGENRQARISAAKNDNALSAMTANSWTKRSIELRNGIAAAYARIK
jgi:hypothetical protein